MQTYLNELRLRGFKSFNRATRLTFGPGLNAVVGSNGSGKSNVLDSICFVLGRLSTKSLRADNYSELVFRRKGKRTKAVATEAEVALSMSNASGVFPIDSRELEILRAIKPSGQTQYRINKKVGTRAQILDLLSAARIVPEGHNLILQGDIARFVEMNPIEKRQVIEEIAGISIYEDRKAAALAELQKVEAKLKEAQIILTEKESYLSNLEVEKAEAEKYRALQGQLEQARATEVKLRVKAATEKETGIRHELDSIIKEISKLSQSSGTSNSKLLKLREELGQIEHQIESAGGEQQLALQRAVDSLKVELGNAKNLIAGSENEIRRVNERAVALEQNLSDIKKKIAEKETEKESLIKQKKELDQTEEKIKAAAGLSTASLKKLEDSITKIDHELETLRTQRDQNLGSTADLQSKITIIDYRLEDLDKKLAEANAQQKKVSGVKQDKTSYKKIIQQIGTLTNSDAEFLAELGQKRKAFGATQEALASLRARARSSEELLKQDRAVSAILDAKKKGALSGIFGTVAQLGHVDERFSTALQVAAGSRMRNIVVESPDVAIKCLNLLKESKVGIATFLPLTALRVPVIGDALLRLVDERDVLGLAANLVDCDGRFNPVFKHVFGDTLVVRDVGTARKLGVGKYRMVTLDGDLFERSGAISGGFRRKGVGLAFEVKELLGRVSAQAGAVLQLKKEIEDLESQRAQIAAQLMELREQKAALEGKIESLKELKLEPLEALQKERVGLGAERNELQKSLKEVVEQNKWIAKQIESKSAKLRSDRAKIKDLQFGEQKDQLDGIAQRRLEIDSSLAALGASLENALVPDQENIERVIRELGKEKKKFEEQIEGEQGRIKKLQRELDAKEQDEKKLYGRLKQMFAKKGRLAERIKAEESSISETEQKVKVLEARKNDLAISNAEAGAQLTALRQELEPLASIEPLADLKSPAAAKKAAVAVQQELSAFGPVNLRALEVYGSIKREFDQLAWRVAKLRTEQQDVVSVIDEIEGKKKDAFIKTYKEVGDHFAQTFSRMTDRLIAALVLENEKSPFEGGIAVRISDQNGKGISVASLSGGEKVLVALGLIFAIQESTPAPFYILDEVDASLDKVNSEKVASLLKDYSKKAQFIIITHNDAIISAADQIYGVSMNKEGESSVISLKI